MICPNCGSDRVQSGAIRGNKKRYWCKECNENNNGIGGWFSVFIEDIPKEDDSKPDIVKKEEGNHLEVRAKLKRVLSLDDLIDATDIDLKVWGVSKWLSNTWEVTSWDKGVKDIATNYQIKAWLANKKPDRQLFPTIEPLNVTIKKSSIKKEKQENDLKTVLVLSDAHMGFRKDIYSGKLTPLHDRRVLDLFLRVSSIIKPDVIVFLGDMMDLGEYSDKFMRSPDLYWTTQPTLIELGWYIGKLRQFNPSADMYYLEGNHEARIRKLLINHYIAGWDLKPVDQLEGAPVMSPQFLLGLDNLGVEYIDDYPNSNLWLNDNIELCHGNATAKHSTDLIKNSLMEIKWNRIMGHNHKVSFGAKTLHEQDRITLIKSYCVAVACHVDGRVPAAGSVNWQQGFGIGTYSEDKDGCGIEDVSISDGSTFFRGDYLEGKDIVEEMVGDIDWKYKECFLN